MDLFVAEKFISHSGRPLDWKVDCDALSGRSIAALAQMAVRELGLSFRTVHGIPRGGMRLAAALQGYATDSVRTQLVVDDVCTTGGSLEGARRYLLSTGVPDCDIVGLVIFARGPVPVWCKTMFTWQGG